MRNRYLFVPPNLTCPCVSNPGFCAPRISRQVFYQVTLLQLFASSGAAAGESSTSHTRRQPVGEAKGSQPQTIQKKIIYINTCRNIGFSSSHFDRQSCQRGFALSKKRVVTTHFHCKTTRWGCKFGVVAFLSRPFAFLFVSVFLLIFLLIPFHSFCAPFPGPLLPADFLWLPFVPF